ncbi:MAG TPA: hypothetical protein DCR55_15280 [Lentisphaeria bacterium]|jgi:hypothetical protein|nr:hypothetical protein [Lentisphaeria bacterium]
MSDHSHTEGPGYEKSDIKLLPIVISSVFILGVILCMILIADVIFIGSTQAKLLERAQYERVELTELTESQSAMLSGYAKSSGTGNEKIVRIPIERAMELIVQESQSPAR